MKKTLSLILATVLLFALALPAAADGQTQTVTVNYEAPETEYRLTIPANQTITDGVPNNIGMVHVTSSKNFFNQHLTVECQISQFKGANKNLVFPGFLAFHPQDGETDAIDGNGHSVMRDGNTESSSVTEQAQPLVLNFYDVTGEEGALEDKARCDGTDGPVYVDHLWAHVYLSGNKAPTDTYSATVTYTATVNVNS